jgi:hypothetical protein
MIAIRSGIPKTLGEAGFIVFQNVQKVESRIENCKVVQFALKRRMQTLRAGASRKPY